MEIRLLGPTEVWSSGEELHVGGHRLRTVLAVLALDVGRVVTADRLIDVVWGERPPATASGQVHTSVWRLRRVLGDVIETRPSGYVLRLERTATDVAVFDDLCAAGRAAATAGRIEQAARSFRDALSLWRGSALADVPALAGEAARLEELRLAALEARVEADFALGAHAGLIGELTSLATQFPLRERLHGHLMTALHRAGRGADALAAYRRLRENLATEVGMEPTPELRELQRRVLAEEPAPEVWDASGDPFGPDPGFELAGQAPRTRYAEVDGIHVAYQVLGTGDVDVVLVPGVLSHLDLWWADPRTAGFHRRLATFGRLILLDKRGTGLSDRPARARSIEDHVEDVRAVMDAAGSERAVLIGYSEGGPISMLYAASHPERVARLVLVNAAARWSAADDYPCGQGGQEMFDDLEKIGREQWGRGATIDWYAPSLAHSENARALVGRRERMSVSPNDYRRMLAKVRETDVRPVLPLLDLPVLVVQRADDRVTPPCHGRFLAEHLPNARYVEHPGDHVIWLGDTDAFFSEVETFVQDAVEVARPERVLTTVLVAQVVDPAGGDSGSAGDRLGGVLDPRPIVARERGRYVEQGPTTLLATFSGPARAIDCANGLADEAGRGGLSLRVGLHVGEAGLADGAPIPAARNVATRLATLGGAGEVLVSRTVKDLVVGSGTRFTERGSHLLHDDADRWAVYAVDRQDAPM